MNLADECLEVRRDPDRTASHYRAVVLLTASDGFESVAIPELAFRVSDLLA